MKQFFVLGVVMTLAASSCATRGYVRRQAATVNDRVSQVQAQATTLSDKHTADAVTVNDRITAADSKLQETAASAAEANANAAQANASAARAEANAAQANASAARAEANAAQANASAARAEAATAVAEANAARERAAIAQNTPPPAPIIREGNADQSKPPATLPTTGSPLPLIALSGLFSLGAAGVLRFLRW